MSNKFESYLYRLPVLITYLRLQTDSAFSKKRHRVILTAGMISRYGTCTVDVQYCSCRVYCLRYRVMNIISFLFELLMSIDQADDQ